MFFSRSISIYKSSQGSKKVRLQHFFAPDKSTVMSLACTPQNLYAGLVNGAVAIYEKAEGNCICAARMRPVAKSGGAVGFRVTSPSALTQLVPGTCGFPSPDRSTTSRTGGVDSEDRVLATPTGHQLLPSVRVPLPPSRPGPPPAP